MGKHYIFERSEKVTRTTVHYPNRYGIVLYGELYMAKHRDENKISRIGDWRAVWRRRGAGAWRVCEPIGTERLHCPDV